MIWTHILKVSVNNKTIYDKKVCIQNDTSSHESIKQPNCEKTNNNVI